jgi:hypothetical protein
MSGSRSLALCLPALLIGVAIASAQQAAAPAAPAVTRVVANSKVFIEPVENGSHTALGAAIHKKKIPLLMVNSADKADYVIAIVGQYQKAGWAKTLMSGGGARGEASASMTVSHRESGAIVFAYNVDKGSAVRGMQSAAEACAKHLGNHIKGKE